jgi:hypothetical protein
LQDGTRIWSGAVLELFWPILKSFFWSIVGSFLRKLFREILQRKVIIKIPRNSLKKAQQKPRKNIQ